MAHRLRDSNMRTKIRCGVNLLGVAAVVIVMASTVTVIAHHAFGAEFDPNRPVILRGPVIRVEWVKPTHVDPHGGHQR